MEIELNLYRHFNFLKDMNFEGYMGKPNTYSFDLSVISKNTKL